MLQSIVMLLRQLRDGRAGVENQYKRVVPWEGNRAALGAMAEVFELRPYFEWRGTGLHLAVGAAHSGQLCRLGCRAALPGARRSRDRSEGGPVRRGAERCAEAGPVQVVRQASARPSTRSAR